MSEAWEAYVASKVGGNLWMVKRYRDPGNHNDYVEALISVETDDSAVAIQAAIERGSWA